MNIQQNPSNMNNPLITIGIPIYNVEPYLEKCLLSILNQTYQNLEILAIDDCGKDNSMGIVRDMQKTHPLGHLIKILKHDQNMGQGEARNTIIKNATGKYIYFLDSDDYIEPQTIDLMQKEAEMNNTDVVIASMRIVIYETGEIRPAFTYPSRMLLTGEDDFPNLVCQDLRWHVGITSCNTLFSTDFLRRNNLHFSVRKDEDALFLSDFYSEVKRAVLLPDITYNYVGRKGSTMGNQARDVIPVWEIRERFKGDKFMTERCDRLRERSFYDVHCARVVKHKFRAVCVALRHRKRFSEKLSNQEIANELKHPARFRDILKFKRYRGFHLLFYTLSKLPSPIAVATCYVIGKAMRWV